MRLVQALLNGARKHSKYLIFYVSSIVLASCSFQNTPSEDLALAKHAMAKQEFNTGVLHLKSALVNWHDKAEVSAPQIKQLLGTAYLGLGNMPQASRFLAQAVSANYQLEESVPRFARALFHNGQYEVLIDLANQYAAELPSLSIQMKLYKILALHKSGQFSLAEQHLSAMSNDATSTTLGLFTQAFTQAKQSPDKSLELVDMLLEQTPDAIDAWLLKGQILISLEQFDQAYSAFHTYLASQKDAKHVHFLLALSAYKLDDIQTMQSHVSKLLALNSNQPLANHFQALIYLRQQNFEGAKQHSEASIQFGLTSFGNYFVAGLSSLNLEKDEQAFHHLVKATSMAPQNQQVRKLLTLVQLKLGYLQDAALNFETLSLSDDGDLKLGNTLVSRLIDNEQLDTANAILAKMQFAPSATPLLTLKQGILHLQAGNDEGLAIIEKLASHGTSAEIANIVLIVALADSGSLDQALLKARQWQTQVPDNVDAMNVLALILQKNQALEEAAHWYNSALSVNPNSIPALLFTAYDAVKKGDVMLANKQFKRVLELVPNHSRAFEGALRLALTKIDANTLQASNPVQWQALYSLIQVEQAHSKVLEQLANAMFNAGAYKTLAEVLAKSSNKNQWTAQIWRLWLKTQSIRNGQVLPSDAVALFLAQNDAINDILFAIALLDQQQQYQKIIHLVDSLVKRDQVTIELRYAKANALLGLKEIDKASFLISQLSKQEPLPAFDWLQGQLALLNNDLKRGKALINKHFDQQPTLAGLTKLVNWAAQDNAFVRIVEMGERYLTVFPNDHLARAYLSNKLMLHSPNAAISLIDVPQSQQFIMQNWQVANNLAWLHVNGENKQRALRFSQHAYRLQASNNNVALTHSAALLHTGQHKQALTILKAIENPNAEVTQLIVTLVKNEGSDDHKKGRKIL